MTVSSPALQDQQIATTDAAGFYRIPNLPPGVYFIRFDKENYLPNEHGTDNSVVSLKDMPAAPKKNGRAKKLS